MKWTISKNYIPAVGDKLVLFCLEDYTNFSWDVINQSRGVSQYSKEIIVPVIMAREGTITVDIAGSKLESKYTKQYSINVMSHITFKYSRGSCKTICQSCKRSL